jgi:hypothetical protein
LKKTVILLPEEDLEIVENFGKAINNEKELEK